MKKSNSNSQKTKEALDRSITLFFEKMSEWEESVARKVNLTPRQCHAISEIGECGPVRMKPISERLGVTTGTMTIMADRLERLNMVQRKSDVNDRRASLLTLSSEGEEVFKEHTRHHRRLSREFITALGEGDAVLLVKLLGKLSDLL
ncbi:MAG: MarR family transcriptional regulator [Spirochaetes bacterium]|jgi:DNA-binding MarR family transcriptional regulator|nr:MarR family transcriptional regulator [Spirochaetota bacterium]